RCRAHSIRGCPPPRLRTDPPWRSGRSLRLLLAGARALAAGARSARAQLALARATRAELSLHLGQLGVDLGGARQRLELAVDVVLARAQLGEILERAGRLQFLDSARAGPHV